MFLRAVGHFATPICVDFFDFFFGGVGFELNVPRLCYVVNRLDGRVDKWATRYLPMAWPLIE